MDHPKRSDDRSTDGAPGAPGPDVEQAMAEAERSTRTGAADRFIERLVDRIGGQAGVSAVFGAPIERDGLTIVPVARVRWAFGGGAGGSQGPEEPVAGAGGGGGVSADPLGFIEIGGGTAKFRATAGLPSPFFILASGLTAVMVFRAIARLAASRPAKP